MNQVDELKSIVIDAANSGYGYATPTAHKFARKLFELTEYRGRINLAFEGTTASRRQQVACIEGIIGKLIAAKLLTSEHKVIDLHRADPVPAA
jgi:hypothetical protein